MGDSAGRLHRVVVVGASIAGLTTVEELREEGYDGAVTLVDAEPGSGYSRPALSKSVLAGELEPVDVRLAAVDDLDVERVEGAVTGLDLDRGVVRLGHDELPFDGLVVATGARARTLRDLGADGTAGRPELTLRSMADALALRERLTPGLRIVIVGAGILGMEIASTALGLGVDVTVVDVVAPLTAQCGPLVSGVVTRRAIDLGLDVVLAAGGARLLEVGGRPAVGVGDTVLEADLVVSAVGCLPNTEWLATSGLDVRRGLAVDSRCRAAARVVAAGDVVAFGDPPRRTPHWANALDQARTAARALLHGDAAEPLRPRPYFWTDQFGLAIRIAGSGPLDGEPERIDGEPGADEGVWRWSRDGVPHRAAAINKRIPLTRLHRYAGQAT